MSRIRIAHTDVCIWHAPDLKAELLHGRFVDFVYDVHTHETACFALLTAGRIRIRMRGTEFVAQRGDIYAIDADEPHAGWAVDNNGWQLRTLYVDTEHLRALIGDEHPQGAVSVLGPIVRDPRVAHYLHTLHRCSQESGPLLVRDEAYIAFAAELMRRHVRAAVLLDNPGNEMRAICAVREFLDERLDDQVSLQALADHAMLPPFVLFRAFERATGMTPHGYQRQSRVRLVMKLLRAGQSISEASAATGFSDQAHCTRWFRRFMGVTPGQYQSAVLGSMEQRVQ